MFVTGIKKSTEARNASQRIIVNHFKFLTAGPHGRISKLHDLQFENTVQGTPKIFGNDIRTY